MITTIESSQPGAVCHEEAIRIICASVTCQIIVSVERPSHAVFLGPREVKNKGILKGSRPKHKLEGRIAANH